MAKELYKYHAPTPEQVDEIREIAQLAELLSERIGKINAGHTHSVSNDFLRTAQIGLKTVVMQANTAIIMAQFDNRQNATNGVKVDSPVNLQETVGDEVARQLNNFAAQTKEFVASVVAEEIKKSKQRKRR